MNDTLPSVMCGLHQSMRCCLLTNPQGQVLIAHDQPIGAVEWIEFNPNDNSFTLVFDGGSMQPLGLDLNLQMKQNLSHGQEVALVYMVEQDIRSTQKTMFIIQDY